MSEFKLEKGIPRPRPTGTPKYPLGALEIDDSFFIPGGTNQTLSGCFLQHRPKRFSVRTLVEDGVKGVRVWRIK